MKYEYFFEKILKIIRKEVNWEKDNIENIIDLYFEKQKGRKYKDIEKNFKAGH